MLLENPFCLFYLDINLYQGDVGNLCYVNFSATKRFACVIFMLLLFFGFGWTCFRTNWQVQEMLTSRRSLVMNFALNALCRRDYFNLTLVAGSLSFEGTRRNFIL